MPPALVAELEDVAEQLARLCGELGVDDDGEVDQSDSELDDDDNDDVDDAALDVGGGRDSLMSSLAAATSECEALMELLSKNCEDQISLSSRRKLTCSSIASSNKSDDGSEDGPASEDQRDIQLQEEALYTRTRDGEHEIHRGAILRDRRSDEINLGRDDGLMNELDAFASELEALSSLIAVVRDGSPGKLQDISDGSGSNFDREDENEGDSTSEPQQKAYRVTTTCCPKDLKSTTVQTGPRSVQPDDTATSQTVQAAILHQNRTPTQPKHRARRRSLGHILRLRTRKKASSREKDLKRTIGVGNSATNEAYWNEFQRKTFARHISRQQLARLRVMEEQAAEERLVAARFQHSATLPRTQQTKGVKQEKSPLELKPVCKAEDRSYLDRFFHRQEPKSGEAIGDRDDNGIRDKDTMTCVLCGVYVYGHRHDSVVYITFTSMAQLRERIASRLGVNPFVNLYRERGMSTAITTSASAQPLRDANHRLVAKKQLHPSRLLQRVSSFDQIADGDMLCATQDAYEDMAILCEWMTERRQRPSPAGTSPTRLTRPSKTPSRGVRCEQAPSNAVPALRRMVEGDAARSNRPKTDIPPLWDCNGRSICIGDAAYRARSAPNDSTRTRNAPKSAHQPRTRK